jgi:hypothetical protein
MARMNSRVRHGFDSLLELDDGATAHTTVGTNWTEVGGVDAFIDLLSLTDAYWDNNEIALNDSFAIDLNILTADGVNADETYVIKVQIDAVSTFDDNPVTVLEYTHTRATTGLRHLVVSRAHLQELDYEARFLRLIITAGGTTPSMTLTAFVAPVRN